MNSTSLTTKPFHAPGYQVLRVIGSGAGSTIWEVRDAKTGRSATLKRVVRQSADDERFFAQVYNEWDIASQIDHPNIRKVYDLRKVRHLLAVRELHLIMEFCPGRSVEQHRPQGIAAICDIFAQAGNALARMHDAGFLHADIKPNNIIVDAEGNVKLIDLGQSCRLGTIKDRIQGTPDFMAPEQVYRWPLGHQTDVFNWGAALYWTLTGKPIPTAMPHIGALKSEAGPTIIPPSQLNRAVTPLLEKLILECVELDPKRRPGSAQEVVSRLGVVLQKYLESTSNGPA